MPNEPSAESLTPIWFDLLMPVRVKPVDDARHFPNQPGISICAM
ncbi:MAG: hypothetical protein PVG41_07080 [Desulfobacteraceae bacterium]|jgi:hypothetical protein